MSASTPLKVIPLKNKELTKDKLVKAVGKVVADVGFRRLGVNLVAREAGVDKKLIYRYFNGLEGLVAAYGRTIDFWPSATELLNGEKDSIRQMSPHDLMALFFKRYVRAILARPYTLEILAWEGVERNYLTDTLEEVRIKTALEFFEMMETDPPEGIDLTALVLFVAAGLNYLAVRSRMHSSLGGVDLQSEEGWKRIDKVVDQLIEGVLH